MIVRKSSLDWEWILEQEAVLTALTQDHFFASLAVVFIGYVLWGGTFDPGGHSGDPGRRVVLRFLGWPSVGQLCIDSRSHPGLSDQPKVASGLA